MSGVLGSRTSCSSDLFEFFHPPFFGLTFVGGRLVWIAENIATFFAAWEYPSQAEAWSPVHLGKVSS
ncbi:hypothetical protein HPL003_08540 [Paenibacillus terrae HPL-003]|uniref:Uncharacterized protein n=1 Tax=Paenibacillus terrae (strain HPL-003) TaxID=985665 RepID=G7VYE3_PAETH|nr:hypothetical protein HPL003_08540 [Paenibacillus terrae HPL-003]